MKSLTITHYVGFFTTFDFVQNDSLCECVIPSVSEESKPVKS
jgi:hypothetical protein